MTRVLILLATHVLVGMGGFAAGVYLLPILIAPPAPTAAEVSSMADAATYTAEFRRDVGDSDALHWGEGKVFVGPNHIALDGEVAPGPAYGLYLSPVWVKTEAEFARERERMVRVGRVDTFTNFIVPLPAGTDLEAHTSVVIWCEAFDQFITSASYR